MVYVGDTPNQVLLVHRRLFVSILLPNLCQGVVWVPFSRPLYALGKSSLRGPSETPVSDSTRTSDSSQDLLPYPVQIPDLCRKRSVVVVVDFWIGCPFCFMPLCVRKCHDALNWFATAFALSKGPERTSPTASSDVWSRASGGVNRRRPGGRRPSHPRRVTGGSMAGRTPTRLESTKTVPLGIREA